MAPSLFLSTHGWNTPWTHEPALAAIVGARAVLIKHEECAPSGSHKDRSLWPWMESLIAEGKRSFVLSSSGNAAVSACAFLSRLPQDIQQNIRLDLWVAPSLSDEKRSRIASACAGTAFQATVNESARPRQQAFLQARERGFFLLRASRDERALEGYRSLAREIADTVPDAEAVFIPTSSGTALCGLYRAFQRGEYPRIPQLHAVQTARIHPIAAEFDSRFSPSQFSRARAIVDRVAFRKKDAVAAVRSTGGSGWVVDDVLLEEARDQYCRKGAGHPCLPEREAVGYDALLSLAGAMKAHRHGWQWKGALVLLFSGL